jgi:glycosyltransferase involved in cell wall biosynthesis
MNIGFEAKRVFQNRTGLGNASRNYVHALATFFAEHQYKLFSAKHTLLFNDAAYKNVSVIQPLSFLHKKLPSYWRSGGGMISQIQQENIDIFIGLSAELPAGIEKTNAKKIVVVYDLIWERYPEQYKAIDRTIYTKKAKYACKVADKIFVISSQTKQDLMDFYAVPADKIEVVFLSIDDSFYISHTTEELQKNKIEIQLPEKYFISVGTVIERKGLLHIAEAMRNIPQEFHLVIVGNTDSPYAEEVKNFVQKNALTHRIHWMNDKEEGIKKIAQQSLPQLYKNSCGLIYPSVFEGFGMPIIEAMACGVPVITSNASCMPEVADDAALLVPPTDAKAITDAAVQLINDKELKEKLVNKGKQRALDFTHEAIAKKMMQTITSIVQA